MSTQPVARARRRTPAQQEQGAALIFLVLMVLVILCSLIIVSANLAVNARRNTGEQRVALQSQYAAESGVSLARAKLGLFYAMTRSIVLPKGSGVGTDRSDIRNIFGSICGRTPITAGIGVYDPYTPTSGTQKLTLNSSAGTISGLDGVVMCDFATDPYSKSAVAGFFKTYLTNTEKTQLNLDDPKIDSFIDDLIAPATLTGNRLLPTEKKYDLVNGQPLSGNIESRFSIIPLAVSRPALDTFVFYFMVSDLKVASNVLNGSRAVSSSPNNAVNRRMYSFTAIRGSFAKYALFTNHHFATYTSETSSLPIYMNSAFNFSGPVHTNQKLSLFGSPYFGGKMTSSGCPANQIVPGNGIPGDPNEDEHCAVVGIPGSFFGSPAGYVRPSEMLGVGDPIGFPLDSDLNQTVNFNGASPNFAEGSTWNHDFVPLPKNGTNQKVDASSIQNGTTGLFIDSGAKIRKISLGVSGTSPKFQTITYTKVKTTGTVPVAPITTELRFDSDSRMQIRDKGTWVAAFKNVTTGEWQAGGGVAAKFNGVIYSTDGVDSMYTDPTTSGKNGAAIAEFAQISVGADRDVVITDHLKYERPPCTGSDPKLPNCDDLIDSTTQAYVRNVLGIYSILGQVQIANNPNSRVKNTDPDAGLLNAPDNVTVNAVLLAAGDKSTYVPNGGSVNVQNPGLGLSKGKLNLLGGVIENYYGQFGTFSPKTGNLSTGMAQNFIYDQRMETGFAPPSFPTQRSWDGGLSQYDMNGTALRDSSGSLIPVASFSLSGDITQVAP